MDLRKPGYVCVAVKRSDHVVNLSRVVGPQMREDGGIGNRWEWNRLGSRRRPNHACLCLIVIQCCWYLVYVLMYECKEIWKTKE